MFSASFLRGQAFESTNESTNTLRVVPSSQQPPIVIIRPNQVLSSGIVKSCHAIGFLPRVGDQCLHALSSISVRFSDYQPQQIVGEEQPEELYSRRGGTLFRIVNTNDVGIDKWNVWVIDKIPSPLLSRQRFFRTVITIITGLPVTALNVRIAVVNIQIYLIYAILIVAVTNE